MQQPAEEEGEKWELVKNGNLMLNTSKFNGACIYILTCCTVDMGYINNSVRLILYTGKLYNGYGAGA